MKLQFIERKSQAQFNTNPVPIITESQTLGGASKAERQARFAE